MSYTESENSNPFDVGQLTDVLLVCEALEGADVAEFSEVSDDEFSALVDTASGDFIAVAVPPMWAKFFTMATPYNMAIICRYILSLCESDQRGEFERAYRALHTDHDLLERAEDGDYLYPQTQAMFDGWMLRATHHHYPPR